MHNSVKAAQARVLRWSALTLELDHQQVRVAGVPVELSPAEFSILHLFLCRRNEALTKDAILDAVYMVETRPDACLIDVFVQRIRRKLAAAGLVQAIASVWGRGYALVDQGEDDVEPQSPFASGWCQRQFAAA